jgi:hypothetical protein
MNRRTVLLLVLVGLSWTGSFAQAGPLADMFHRPRNSAAVTVTSQYSDGSTKTRLTYPGYTYKSTMKPPGWILYGYPGTNFPTSRNFNDGNGFNGP